MTMHPNDPEPSASSAPPSARQRAPAGRSQLAYNPPSHRITLSHHRTPSAPALTVQTHFARQSTLQSQQAHQEVSANPRFSRLLNTALGSPFLTTADISQAPSHFNLDGNEVEERDLCQLRPPSPTPTADYSMIDIEEADLDSSPDFRIPGSYPYGHQGSMSSSFAGLGPHSNSAWSSQRGRSYYTTPGPGPPFASFNHPTGSMSMPNVSPPSSPFRALLPRLWDTLSLLGRTVISGNNKSLPSIPSPTSSNPSAVGSPLTFPHSISLPTTLFGAQPLSGHQSPLVWGGLPKNNNRGKGKGKALPSHSSLLNSESDYSDLSPLDGEEGELIDEACFVDVIAITGVDILALLPPELALYILHLVCPPSLSRDLHTTILDPLSNEVEESSKIALYAILACLTVSRKWRRLADDNSVWRLLFLARWDIDLRRADLSHMRKVGSVVRFVGTPPRHQQRRHKWNFKYKAQALKSDIPIGVSTDPSHVPPPIIAPVHRVRPVSQPDESFPLWFDWKKMYTERLELERRWRGTAYSHIPTLPFEALPLPRGTSRCMTNRGAPRSRSLSPARLLGPTSSSGPAALSTSPTVPGADQLAARSGLGDVVFDSGALLSSRTEPAGLGALPYRAKWEPEMKELKGHTDSVYCVEFDSKRIITGSRDRTIRVWSLKTGKLLGSISGAHRGSVLCLKFEKDWDFSPVCLSPAIGKGRNDNISTPLSADLDFNSGSGSDMGYGLEGETCSKKRSGFMVSGSSDCTICVWKLENGEILGGEGSDDSEDGDREVKAKRVAILKGHTGGVLDLRIDRKWIVSSSKDTVIRVWDRKSLRLHRMLRGHEAPVNAIGLQDGKVVSASGDGKIILWDIESGERLRTLEGRDRGLTCIEFKNNLIVSGSSDCQIRLWSAWTGECLRTLSGHNALVRALSFDPRTGWLVSASYDRVIKLWDLRSGKLIRQFKHIHAGYIYDVKFDVGRLVSSSHDQRVCVFDFTAGLDASVFV